MPGNDTGSSGEILCINNQNKRMVRPKKNLGQHFLRDDSIANRIAGYLDPQIPQVLEIGPGTGVLTRHILEQPSFDLKVIEIDNESVEYLTTRFPELHGRILHDDFLRTDLTRLFHPADVIQVIGNFPYNISSQILFRVLEHKDLVKQVTGMFQQEVAARIASPPGSRVYGILSVLLQAWYDIDYLFTVDETVFFPPPKVKSGVIRLRRNGVKSLECNEDLFVRVVKTTFNQRRKTIRNSIRGLARTGLQTPSPLLDLRPEQCSVDQFVELTRLVDDNSPEIS